MTDKRAGEEITSRVLPLAGSDGQHALKLGRHGGWYSTGRSTQGTVAGEHRDLKSIRELGYAHIRVAGYALGENPRYRRELGGI